MLDKTQVIKTIESLPDTFSIEELMEEVPVLEKIKKGQDDIQSGKIYTETQAKERLGKWLK